MSRFSATKLGSGNTVTYGLDHILGWFYSEENAKGEIIADEDSALTGLGRGRLLELLDDTNAPKEHCFLIAMDLDPATK